MTAASPPPPEKDLGLCSIPDLPLDSYTVTDGCQCQCVLSWGSVVPPPALAPVSKDTIESIKKGFLDTILVSKATDNLLQGF